MTIPTNLVRFAPLSIVLAIACGNDTNPNNNPDVDPQVEEPNAARGSVFGVVGSDMQTRSVTAFRVNTDGSLTAISESGDVQDDGSFTLDVLTEGNSDSTLIIGDSATTTSGSLTAAVLVSAAIEEDSETAVADMDGETTVETAVFLDLVVDGSTDADGSEAGFIRTLITAEVAAEANADGDSSNDIDGLSEIALGVLVTLDVDDDQASAANDMQSEADVLGTESELGLDALLDLGFDEDELSIGLHAAAEVASDSASDSGSTDAEAAFATEIEEIRAQIAVSIVNDGILGLDLDSDAMGDVDDNNSGLLGGILDLGVGLELSSVWSDWAGELQVILQTQLSVETQSTFNDADQAASEAETELELTLDAVFASESDAEARAMATLEAMSDFESDVRADARVQALFETDLDDEDAQAMIDILVQLHASID